MKALTARLLGASAIALASFALTGCSSGFQISGDDARDVLLAPIDLPEGFELAEDGGAAFGFEADCAPGRQAADLLRFAEQLGFVAYADEGRGELVSQGAYRFASSDDVQAYIDLITQATSGECDAGSRDDGSLRASEEPNWELDYVEAQPLARVVDIDAEGIVWDNTYTGSGVSFGARVFVLVNGTTVVVVAANGDLEGYQALADAILDRAWERLAR